ncbi:putative transmembrane protein 184B [Faustovirus]|nr:putative transmembrane protein 184B [Faustovirus]
MDDKELIAWLELQECIKREDIGTKIIPEIQLIDSYVIRYETPKFIFSYDHQIIGKFDIIRYALTGEIIEEPLSTSRDRPPMYYIEWKLPDMRLDTVYLPTDWRLTADWKEDRMVLINECREKLKRYLMKYYINPNHYSKALYLDYMYKQHIKCASTNGINKKSNNFERPVIEYVKRLLPIKEIILNFRPKWLHYKSKHALEIDIWLPEWELGIECNGGGHGWSETPELTIAKDAEKIKIMKRMGFTLLVVDQTNFKNMIDAYVSELKAREPLTFSYYLENVNEPIKKWCGDV